MGRAKGKQRSQPRNDPRKRLALQVASVVGAIVLAGVLIVAGSSLVSRNASAAPTWTATTAEGETLSSDDLKGSVYVMDFFFLTCGICEIQMPKNKGLVDALAERDDFKFISVTSDPSDTTPAILQHQREKNATWPHVRDTFDLYQKFNVRGNPNLVFVDREGNIAFTITQITGSESLIEQALLLLDGRAGSTPAAEDGAPSSVDHDAAGHGKHASRTTPQRAADVSPFRLIASDSRASAA